MSGNTIGGIAGGLIGFAITGTPMGAQWGWMIGSVVGGIVDPQTIQGAQWQNQQLQGSADGLARAVVFGTATVTGNLLDAEPGGPRIGKMSEGGKGGPQVERDTAILTYAIEICDSSELRGTTVLGVIAVWEDEKLVYDLRPDESGAIPSYQQVASAKWIKNKKFYFGGEDQEPPPELEAIHGIGNVPAYRGSCIMTVLDEDLMVDVDDKPRGRIPTYKFLVSVCEPVLPGTPAFMVTGSEPVGVIASSRVMTGAANWVGDTDSLITATTDSAVRIAIRNSGKFFAFLGGELRYAGIDELDDWQSAPPVYFDTNAAAAAVAVGNKILITNGTYGLVAYDSDAMTYSAINVFGGTTIRGIASGVISTVVSNTSGSFFSSSDGADSFSLSANVFLEFSRYFSVGGIDTNGGRFISCGVNDLGAAAIYSDDGGYTWASCTLPATNPETQCHQVKWVGKDRWMISTTGGDGAINGFFVSTDDGLSFSQIATSHLIYDGGGTDQGAIAVNSKTYGVLIIGRTFSDGATKIYHSTDEFLAQWDEVSYASDLSMVPNRVWDLNPLVVDNTGGNNTPIPDVPGYYVDADGNIIGPDLPVGTACSAPLDQVVRKLYKLGAPQLVDSEFDLTALESDIVRGYVVQDANVTVAEACEPLRKVYNFDLPAYDGQVHAIKRGRATDWTLNEDDLVAMDSEYEESMQDDSVSYPKKLHLGYIDASLDYKMTTQISERYSADVRVVGEEKTDMQLGLSATEAKQAVVKLHKVMWANIEETRKLTIPLEYIEAVNSDTFTFRSRRYRIDQMRVEGLNVVLESAAYDRINNYQSNAVGVEGQGAPDIRGSVRGPTISVIMNLPVLRPEDDKPGVYWASTGVLSGWDGARLLVSRYGANYVDTGVVSGQKSVIARLTEAVPIASRYGIDRTTTIRIKMVNNFGSISGTTFDGLLRRDRAAALVKPNGTAEIIQFLTATEVAPREYEIGGLLRGRLNTAPSAHDAGAYFVLLDESLRFVELGVDDATAPLTFKAVTLYTNAEDNIETDDYTGYFESVREWTPACVRYDYDGTSLNVTWAGRGRIGSSRTPYNSANFKQQYRVTVLGGSGGVEIETGAQSYSFAGLSSWDSISVVALSRIANTYNSEEGTE